MGTKAARGRPPKLSRERILRHALRLVESEPGELPTLGRIVDDLDAVPSALYRHFRSRDELLDALLALAIGDLELELRRDAAWTQQVRDWMRSIHRHLIRYPGLVPRIADGPGRTSAAWLSATARLVEILERAGFRGRELALAVLFVAESVVGSVLQQGPRPLSGHLAAAAEGLAGVPASERAPLERLLSAASGLDSEALFDFVVERCVAALVALAGRRAPRGGASRA